MKQRAYALQIRQKSTAAGAGARRVKRQEVQQIASKEWEDFRDDNRVQTEKKMVAEASWARRLAEARERNEVYYAPGASFPDVTMGMTEGDMGTDLGAPSAQLGEYFKKKQGKKRVLPRLSELRDEPEAAFEADGHGVESEGNVAGEAANASTAASSAEDDLADVPYDELPGSEKNKYVESEIMKMEARVLKAATRKEAKAAMHAVTHPAQSMFVFNNKLLPPPPNITNILVPSALEMGDKIYVEKEFKLVYQGGPNDTYLDTGPNAASEVAFFGAEGCGKSELIEAITEQRKLSPRTHKAGSVRTIDFYQAPDPKLWRDAWADGPTKYPAATRLSRTHWGGMIVDLPGHTKSELRPDAEDSIYQCLSQYYEGTRRQLKGTFYCIDATKGLQKYDLKWLKTLSDLHTRVSIVNVVLTKADLVSHAELVKVMTEIYKTLGRKEYRLKVNLPLIPTSAVYGWGVKELRGYVAMQAEMVPWWKRVEEQKAAVDMMREPVAEMKDKLLEERVKMAKNFKMLDNWNTAVEHSINDAVQGGQEEAYEAEYALAKLEKKQEKMGMFMQSMGARHNPLIKNPYLQQTVSGGAPIGPGMAPTSVKDLVETYKDVTPPVAQALQTEMAALKTEATEFPSAASKYHRDWLTRGLGEWTDARRGADMYTPGFRSDPDLTREDWETLPQDELEAKIIRTGDTTRERMRYGFELSDIRDDVKSSLADEWNASIGAARDAHAAPPATPAAAGRSTPAEGAVDASFIDTTVVEEGSGGCAGSTGTHTHHDAATVMDVTAEPVLEGGDGYEREPLGEEFAGLPFKIRERMMALRDDEAPSASDDRAPVSVASSTTNAAAADDDDDISSTPAPLGDEYAGLPLKIRERMMAMRDGDAAAAAASPATPAPVDDALDSLDDVRTPPRGGSDNQEMVGDVDGGHGVPEADYVAAAAYRPSPTDWHPLKPLDINNDFQLRVNFAMRPGPPVDEAVSFGDFEPAAAGASTPYFRDPAYYTTHAGDEEYAVPEPLGDVFGAFASGGGGGGSGATPPAVFDLEDTVRRLAEDALAADQPPAAGAGGSVDADDGPTVPPPPTWAPAAVPARGGTELDTLGHSGDATPFRSTAAAKMEAREDTSMDSMDTLAEAGLAMGGSSGAAGGTGAWESAAAQQAMRLKRDASPGVSADELARQLAEAALPTGGLDALSGGDEAFDAASVAGMGLGQAEASSFGDALNARESVKASQQQGKLEAGNGAAGGANEHASHQQQEQPRGQHTASSDSPNKKWASFTQLLNALPSDILKAAQPVHRRAKVYKPEHSEPGHTGVSLKMNDGLGVNNEPTLLDEDVITKEVKEKQMGPHYMGFPWMSHEQIPTAVAIHSQEKAQEMMLNTYTEKARAVALNKRSVNFGPLMFRPISERVKQRHQRELITQLQQKEENKGKRNTVLVHEVVDPMTNFIRYQAVEKGMRAGPIAYSPEIVGGQKQMMAPGRQMKYERRLVAMGVKDKVEVELGFRKLKGDPLWYKKVPKNQLVWYASRIKWGGNDILPHIDGRGRVSFHFNKRHTNKTVADHSIAEVAAHMAENRPMEDAAPKKKRVKGARSKGFQQPKPHPIQGHVHLGAAGA